MVLLPNLPARIRTAAERDLPDIVALLAQLSIDSPREELGPPLPQVYDERFGEILSDPNQSLLVAEGDDGSLIGTLCVVVVPNLSYRAKPYAIIENVVVDASARRQGVGEALMNEAVRIAEAAGCYKVALTTNKDRGDAHRFYESIGFRATHFAYRRNL